MSLFSIVPIDVCADDRLTKMQLRVLIALLSFRNKNTDTCFPKRKALSERCGYTEQTISKITKQLVYLGWLQKEGLGGYSSPCTYRVTVPDLETVSKVETVSNLAMLTVSEPATTTVAEVDTRKEQTIEQTIEQKPSRTRKSLTTIDEYLSNCKRDGIKPIRDDDPIIAESENTGIPYDWLILNWLVLIERNRESGKKQKDWPSVFRRSVRERWYRIWWWDSNNVCTLSSDGKQAQLRIEGRL